MRFPTCAGPRERHTHLEPHLLDRQKGKQVLVLQHGHRRRVHGKPEDHHAVGAGRGLGLLTPPVQGISVLVGRQAADDVPDHDVVLDDLGDHLLAVLAKGRRPFRHRGSILLPFDREGGDRCQDVLVVVQRDVDLLQLPHKQQDRVVDRLELPLDDGVPSRSLAGPAVAPQRQRDVAPLRVQLLVVVSPDGCCHAEPRVALGVLEAERVVPGLDVHRLGRHEHRLEADALLARVAHAVSNGLFGALAHIADGPDIRRREAVFVARRQDAVVVDGKGHAGPAARAVGVAVVVVVLQQLKHKLGAARVEVLGKSARISWAFKNTVSCVSDLTS